MTALALAALLTTSLSWGALDALRKTLGARLRPEVVVLILCTVPLPLYAAWLARDPAAPAAAYWPWAGGVIALNVAANLLFVRAVTLSPLSVTVPYLALSPVFTALLGALVLSERPGPIQLMGALVVGIGAFGLRRPTADQHRRREPGIPLMIAVAALWSLAVVLDKGALAHATPALHALVQTAGVGLVVAGLLVARPLPPRDPADPHPLRRAWRPALAAGAAQALAMGAQLIALAHVDAGVLEATKRAIGLLMAIALGRLLFGERLTARILAGAGAMAAGAAAVLLG